MLSNIQQEEVGFECREVESLTGMRVSMNANTLSALPERHGFDESFNHAALKVPARLPAHFYAASSSPFDVKYCVGYSPLQPTGTSPCPAVMYDR